MLTKHPVWLAGPRRRNRIAADTAAAAISTAGARRATLNARAGFSLRETVAALLVLALLAWVALPLAGGFRSRTDGAVTQRTLEEVRDAVARYWQDAPGMPPRPHPDDMVRKAHTQLAFLFMNPATWSRQSPRYTAQYTFDGERKAGWRGPYYNRPLGAYVVDETRRFSTMYGETGDPAPVDAWGRPLVLQYGGRTEEGLLNLRLISAGSNGRLDIPLAASWKELDAATVGDDLYVVLVLK